MINSKQVAAERPLATLIADRLNTKILSYWWKGLEVAFTKKMSELNIG